MSTRKRKQDEELVALPSDESEEEEEYVFLNFQCASRRKPSYDAQLASLELLHSQFHQILEIFDRKALSGAKTRPSKSKLRR
jgi:hypothetical protein